MKKTSCDKEFEKEFKSIVKNNKDIKFFSNKQNWILEMLLSFLWLKNHNNNDTNFDLKTNSKEIINFITTDNFKELENFKHLFEFYNLINDFYNFNSTYHQQKTNNIFFIRNQVFKNIIIFIKNNFTHDIDFIINKVIKKT